MNKIVIGSIAFLVINSLALGKVPTSNKTSNNDSLQSTQNVSKKPFRLSKDFVLHAGLVKPSSNFTLEETSYKRKINGEVPMEQSLGLSLGMSYLPVRSLGWNAQMTQIFVNQKVVSNTKNYIGTATIDRIQRTEGNLLFAFNETFFVKAGLNLSTVAMSDTDFKLNSSFGYQFGAGLQVMDNLGLHADYVSMKHQTANNSSFNGVDTSKNLHTDATGLEFGVSALF